MTRTLLALLFSFAVLPAVAIVDVHEEYYSNLDEPAFSTFSFNLDGARGTKQENEFEIENHTMVRGRDATYMFIGSYQFAETNNTKNEDNVFMHLRYVRAISGRHGFDVLWQYGQDEFALIDSRFVFGGGYRYEWTQSEERRGLLGLGAIRERERYLSGVEQDLWRGNVYVTLGRPVSFIPDSTLTFSAYAQPAFSSLDDVRGIAVLNLTTQLTRNLGIEFSLDFTHDSDPEPGFDSTETEFSVGIEWTFR